MTQMMINRSLKENPVVKMMERKRRTRKKPMKVMVVLMHWAIYVIKDEFIA